MTIASRERTRLLNEHAEFLKALTAIDAALCLFESQDEDEDFALRVIRRIRRAMPASIVATRKAA